MPVLVGNGSPAGWEWWQFQHSLAGVEGFHARALGAQLIPGLHRRRDSRQRHPLSWAIQGGQQVPVYLCAETICFRQTSAMQPCPALIWQEGDISVSSGLTPLFLPLSLFPHLFP